MRIFKAIVLLSLFMSGSILCRAASYNLVITNQDNQTSKFKVDDSLEIGFHDDLLTVSAPGKTFELVFDNVRKMGYEKSTHTGVETAKADSDVRIGKDCISVNCASDGVQHFAIFDTDGRTVSAKEFTGHFSFDLNTLATGTYILKIGTMQPVKFVVK